MEEKTDMIEIGTESSHRAVEEIDSVIQGTSDQHQLLREVMPIFNEVLVDAELIKKVLNQLYSENEFVHQNINLINRNEILFYRSPKSGFSLRLFIWEPKAYSIVHDHGSWGVIGACLSRIHVQNFKRNDDGKKPDYADLSPIGEMILADGQATSTLPFDRGIHQVGNPDEKTALSLSLYGKALRRGFIYGFEPERKRAFKIFPPILEKRLLALKTLEDLGWKAPGSLFSEALRDSMPLVCRHGVVEIY